MKILNKFFGKGVPSKNKNIPVMEIGKQNPFTDEFIIDNNILIFNCPSCGDKKEFNIKDTDPITGTPLQCDKCKNVNHIPRNFSSKKSTLGLKITCGVNVPIKQYGNWYSGHPTTLLLNKENKLEYIAQFCLWAFCYNCLYQFPKSVISQLPIAQEIEQYGGTHIFSALTTESNIDMHSLEKGKCPKCSCIDLIAIINDLPNDL